MNARTFLIVAAVGILAVSGANADEQGDRERENALENQEMFEKFDAADQTDYNERLNEIDDREGERCANSPDNDC